MARALVEATLLENALKGASKNVSLPMEFIDLSDVSVAWTGLVVNKKLVWSLLANPVMK